MLVVNCFQNTILVWNSQDDAFYNYKEHSCELLSEYYLSMEFTGNDLMIAQAGML